MKTTMWTYPWDLADEGVEVTVERIVQDYGIDDLAVTATYHAGKFLLPRNPRRKVFFPESGMQYFAWPDDQVRPAPLMPTWGETRQDNRFWDDVHGAVTKFGGGLTVWCLGLHNSGFATRYPQGSVQNVFGDSLSTDLCANAPIVRDYLPATVGAAVSATGAGRALLESFDFMPFQHGFHHEVIGIPLDDWQSFLLSLCFCLNCSKRASGRGVDVEHLRIEVSRRLTEAFAAPRRAGSRDWDWIESLAGGQMSEYLQMRATAVTELISDSAASAVGAGAERVGIVDFGPLYATGINGTTWQSGLDLAVIGDIVDELHPTFYATDADDYSTSVQDYLAAAPQNVELHGALRAILPQVREYADLARRVETLRRDFHGVSFYNYGFMSDPQLGWLSQVTSEFEKGMNK